MDEKQEITKEIFSEAVLLSMRVGRFKGSSVMETIVGLCEQHAIEVEDVPLLIDNRVKTKLEIECRRNGLVKGDFNTLKLF